MNQPNQQQQGQQQRGQQQQNPLFGSAWMQKFCQVEWSDFCDKSPEHGTAVTTVGRESNADVKRELSPAGMGIVQAINLCKGHVDRLAANGEIDGSAAADLHSLLDALKKRAKEEQKKQLAEQERREKGKKEEKSPWAWTQDRNPKVHSIHEFVSSMIPCWANEVVLRFNELENSLNDQQLSTLSEKFSQGIPENQLGEIVSAPNLTARKARAQALGII